MAMFAYNPHPHPDPSQNPDPSQKKDRNTGDADRWHAEIEEDLLTVTNTTTGEKYVVDGFEDKVGCEFDEKAKKDVWYSFDTKSGNFHIVPGMEVGCRGGEGKLISAYLGDKLGIICAEVEEIIKGSKKLKAAGASISVSKPTKERKWVYNHRYISMETGEQIYLEKIQYLIAFNRLWCDDKNHVHNSFGQAQFMCYPAVDKHINLLSDGFKMMYPRSDRDGKYSSEARHLVYNAPYDINDDAKVIAKGFVEFIESCEAKRIFRTVAKFISWAGMCDE